jgi:CHAT domain-containing protein
VLTPSAIHTKEVIIGSDALKEKVHSFFSTVNQVARADSPEGDDAAKDLYQILIAPVEPFLDKSKYLCIVPEKFLNYVPYQALVSSSTGKFLIEDYRLGTAPSATIFVDLAASTRGTAGASEEELLSVGNPNFSRADFDGLVDLRSAAAEARAVANLYPKSDLLIGDEATETRVRAGLPSADVVHLAMHYVVNDQTETLSGFPLSPEARSDQDTANGFLQSYEIYSLGLSRTKLVVLSACQTAIGRQYAGEGAIGAARPFMIAGVPTVVATLWPVDSEASAQLMTSFHAHRTRDHLPVSEALRKAELEMARGADARYRQPYYWAAFQMIGGFRPS